MTLWQKTVTRRRLCFLIQGNKLWVKIYCLFIFFGDINRAAQPVKRYEHPS